MALDNPFDTVDLVVPDDGTESPWVAFGNPAEVGLFVPTIDNATVAVHASHDGTNGGKLVDREGAQVLLLAASTGGFTVSSLEMGAILGYSHIKIVCGAAQTGGPRTFKLTRKLVRVDPLA